MTRLLVRATLALTVALGGTVLLIRGAFAGNPPPIPTPFAGCERLCWIGITPGHTTAPEAIALLESTGADVLTELFSYPTLGRIAEGKQIRARFPAHWVVVGADNDRVSIVESTEPMCMEDVLLYLGLPDEVRVERDRMFMRYERESHIMIFASTLDEMPATRRFWLYDTAQYLSPPVQPSGDVWRWSQAEGYFRGACD